MRAIPPGLAPRPNRWKAISAFCAALDAVIAGFPLPGGAVTGGKVIDKVSRTVGAMGAILTNGLLTNVGVAKSRSAHAGNAMNESRAFPAGLIICRSEFVAFASLRFGRDASSPAADYAKHQKPLSQPD